MFKPKDEEPYGNLNPKVRHVLLCRDNTFTCLADHQMVTQAIPLDNTFRTGMSDTQPKVGHAVPMKSLSLIAVQLHLRGGCFPVRRPAATTHSATHGAGVAFKPCQACTSFGLGFLADVISGLLLPLARPERGEEGQAAARQNR